MYADKQGYKHCTDYVNYALENAYQKKQENTAWVDNAGNKHNVNFKKHTDKVNHTHKTIKRRLVFGKYNFPHSTPENGMM